VTAPDALTLAAFAAIVATAVGLSVEVIRRSQSRQEHMGTMLLGA